MLNDKSPSRFTEDQQLQHKGSPYLHFNHSISRVSLEVHVCGRLIRRGRARQICQAVPATPLQTHHQRSSMYLASWKHETRRSELITAHVVRHDIPIHRCEFTCPYQFTQTSSSQSWYCQSHVQLAIKNAQLAKYPVFFFAKCNQDRQFFGQTALGAFTIGA